MPSRLSTGITEIDRNIEGGFLQGSVVTLVGPSDSQVEVILEQLATERRTLYISTTRRVNSVRRAFEHHNIDTKDENLMFRHLNEDNETLYGEADDPLSRIENAVEVVSQSNQDSNIIVDTMDVLERFAEDKARLIEFFNNINESMSGSESICYLHCVTDGVAPDFRSQTLNLSDAILEIEQNRVGEDLETRLNIPKIRGCSAVYESIKLKLTTTVEVDTSRDIA